MKCFILATSHRSSSQTAKVCQYISNRLVEQGHDVSFHDCGVEPLPMWSPDREGPLWRDLWQGVAEKMESADALILGTPEWHGMATPQAKNFFMLSSSQQLGHKPGLLVSVSAGKGGAYPIAELRASSYKNNRIVWLPEHLIVKEVGSVLNQDEAESPSDVWIRDRIDYALSHLSLYATALSSIRDQLPEDARFTNGM